MDISDDLFISTVLIDSQTDVNFAEELQLQEAIMLSSFAVCDICVETKGKDDILRLDDCTHKGYCKECISRHVLANLRKGQSRFIRCPALDCDTILNLYTCRQFVRADVRRTWQEMIEATDADGVGDGDLKLRDLAKEKKWQMCPNCKIYVEKVSGCLHITCRCQFEFCYACGEAWSTSHGGCLHP